MNRNVARTSLFLVLGAIVTAIACGDSTTGGDAGAPPETGTPDSATATDTGAGTPDTSLPDAGGDTAPSPDARPESGVDSSADGAAPDADPGDAGGDAAPPPWVGPDGGISSQMSFFVTSRGKGTGGDLRDNPADTDGLAGADAFCKSLAEAVSPVLGAKTWRAYLSTTTIAARDRIGDHVWINAKGVTIADSTAHLHDEGAMNLLTFDTNLDELGNPVPINAAGGGNVHDILTGTTASGMPSTDNHCSDWTSDATTVTAQVGHSNRAGGGADPTSWSSAHATRGCAETGTNSVRSGGGRGSFYCFAN